MPWLDPLPIWIIGLILAASLVIAHELGFWFGRNLGDGRLEVVGSTVGAALALLGLLTVFTFGAAQERFDIRQKLVVQEANAISVAYLRAQLIQEPWRTTLGGELLRYARLRVRFPGPDAQLGRRSPIEREVASRQRMIWRVVEAAVRANPTPTVNAPVVQSINEMFDLNASRVAARDNRVPVGVLRTLVLFALVAALLMGLAAHADLRYRLVSTVVLILLTLAFCIIVDLDRPDSGSIVVDQSPMKAAVAEIESDAGTTGLPPTEPSSGVGVPPASE